jgi:hypothetical protein
LDPSLRWGDGLGDSENKAEGLAKALREFVDVKGAAPG